MTDDGRVKKKDIHKSFISGGIAGTLAKTVIAPAERVKIIFQVTFFHQVSNQAFSYSKAYQKAVDIYKHEGLKSFWRGNLLACFRVFPYSAIVDWL